MKTVNTTTNQELSTVTDLLVSRVEELLLINTTILVDSITIDHKENKQEITAIIESLKASPAAYSKVLIVTAKHIIMSAVKELPRTTLISMIAEVFSKSMTAHSRFRLAAVIVKLFNLTESFNTRTKTNTHGFQEYVITLKILLTQSTQEELKASSWKLPTSTPNTTIKGVAGHIKKHSHKNEHMDDILLNLNNVAYTLDARVWNKFKYQLSAYRFEDINTQTSMVEEGDKLLGKTFYFNHRFGPDNGRIYCDGDLFTLQGGALNYVYKFANKEVLTAEGLLVLQDHIKELESNTSMSLKEQVEFYSLTLDLIDGEQGLPVGTILHKDAKLSGLQHQSIATRSIANAKFCGLTKDSQDGYNHLGSKLSSDLTRAMVKVGYNPYQYGAGELSTVTPIEELGGSINYKEWQEAYKVAFPDAFALRSFLIMLSSKYKSDSYEFTSPSGYKAYITALGKVDTAINTPYGKLTYSRKEQDSEFMGVKLVAAFSHMMDASVLHTVIRRSTYDMHVVHDSFGSHPNHVNDVCTNYVHVLQEFLCMPILETYVTDILANKANPEIMKVNVSKLIANTLIPSDIVGGLF